MGEWQPFHYCGRDWPSVEEFAIVMAWEAFRLALSGKTRQFPPHDIIRWLRIITKQKTAAYPRL